LHLLTAAKVPTSDHLTALKLILPGVIQSVTDFMTTIRVDVEGRIEKAQNVRRTLAKEKTHYAAEAKRAEEELDDIARKLDSALRSNGTCGKEDKTDKNMQEQGDIGDSAIETEKVKRRKEDLQMKWGLTREKMAVHLEDEKSTTEEAEALTTFVQQLEDVLQIATPRVDELVETLTAPGFFGEWETDDVRSLYQVRNYSFSI
jgi:hypothetical protein